MNDNVGYDRRLNAIILYGSPDQIASVQDVYRRRRHSGSERHARVRRPRTRRNGGQESRHRLHQPGRRDRIRKRRARPDRELFARNGSSAPNLTASLQANLYLTITHGGGKILATPRVLALNGVPAQILSGDALPIAQTTTIPSGNSYLTQSTINYIAVGINMQIQPRIDPNGFVTSHIFAEASSVTQYVNTGGQSVPQVSLRQVTTEATVKDGQPYILGGLLLDEEIDSLSKIPGIGDLPLNRRILPRASHDHAAYEPLHHHHAAHHPSGRHVGRVDPQTAADGSPRTHAQLPAAQPEPVASKPSFRLISCSPGLNREQRSLLWGPFA